jgi:hypothetical protein
VWKTWFPGVRAAKSCATAPPASTAANSVQRTCPSGATVVTAAAPIAAAHVM